MFTDSKRKIRTSDRLALYYLGSPGSMHVTGLEKQCNARRFHLTLSAIYWQRTNFFTFLFLRPFL